MGGLKKRSRSLLLSYLSANVATAWRRRHLPSNACSATGQEQAETKEPPLLVFHRSYVNPPLSP